MGRFFFLFIPVYLLICSSPLFASPIEKVAANERCPVCGMFVAKYDAWITMTHDKNTGRTFFFDGVKDMMAFYFEPESYGGGKTVGSADMRVKDYYSLEWIAAREAYYVIGSDIYGPMGHEFIPFSSQKAAEAFLNDHHGKRIVKFSDITSDLVKSIRSGQRMR